MHQHKIEKWRYIAWDPSRKGGIYDGRLAPLIEQGYGNQGAKPREGRKKPGGRHGAALQNPVAKAKRFVYKPPMQTMAFTLVTPEATFFSGQAAMVEAPGTLGEFGVLPGHMNFISTLKPGVVRVHDAQDQVSRIFVSGGIAEVNNTSCTILAERVVDLAALSRADAEARLAKAKALLDNTFEEEAVFMATREVELAEAIVIALA